MFTGNIYADDDRRSGALRAMAAQGGMRGLPPAPCCKACAEGLGDDSATGGTTPAVPRWLFVAALGLGAIASGVLLYDRFKPRAKKRRKHRTGSQLVYIPAGGARRATGRYTAQLPVETMADVVHGRRT